MQLEDFDSLLNSDPIKSTLSSGMIRKLHKLGIHLFHRYPTGINLRLGVTEDGLTLLFDDLPEYYFHIIEVKTILTYISMFMKEPRYDLVVTHENSIYPYEGINDSSLADIYEFFKQVAILKKEGIVL